MKILVLLVLLNIIVLSIFNIEAFLIMLGGSIFLFVCLLVIESMLVKNIESHDESTKDHHGI